MEEFESRLNTGIKPVESLTGDGVTYNSGSYQPNAYDGNSGSRMYFESLTPRV